MTNNFIYESEFEEVLLEELYKLYNIEDKNKIFNYSLLRYLCINDIKDTNKEIKNYQNFVLFLLNELNIPIYENSFIYYKDSKIYLRSYLNQSFLNIFDNLIHSNKLRNVVNNEGIECSWEEYISKTTKEIIIKSKRNISKFRNAYEYKYLYINEVLNILNKIFNAKPTSCSKIENIKYPIEHNFIKRTLEEEALAYLNAFMFKTSNSDVLSEEDIEDFLYSNLEVIEEGLKPVERQKIIKGGRIDILAKDKDNNIVIIELKNADDERIVWQSIYYPMQIKKEYKTEKVRMITLSTTYSEYILEALQTLDIEILKLTPKIECGKIEEVKIYSIK